MEKIKLDPETSALILIDLQHGIVVLKTSPHPASSVVAKAASLAATFRKHSSPVIYVRVDLANMLPVHADRSHGDPKNPPPAIASELVQPPVPLRAWALELCSLKTRRPALAQKHISSRSRRYFPCWDVFERLPRSLKLLLEALTRATRP